MKFINKFLQKKYAIGLVVAIYAFVSIILVNGAGLQYDEVLFVNASLGGLDNSFIYYSLGNIPVLLMSYIGALKAYLFAPIFFLFGVSPLTIRLPVIFITGVTIYFIYRTLRLLGIKKAQALLITCLISINATFILLTTYDVGPNVLELLLKVLSIFFITKFLLVKRYRYLHLAGITILLGVFNKLNFIWYVNALVAIWGLYQLFDLKNLLVNIKKWFPLGIYLAVGIIYYFVVSSLFNLAGNLSLKQMLTDIAGILEGAVKLISGASFPEQNFLTLNLTWFFILTFIMIVPSLKYTIYLVRNRKSLNKVDLVFLCSSILTLVIFAQLALTKQGRAAWHYFMLMPFIFVSIGLGIVSLIEFKKTGKVAIGLILSLYVITQVYLLATTSNSFEQPKDYRWSKTIYQLYEYSKNTNNKFLSADWGFHNQLLALSSNPDKYKNIFEEVISKKYLLLEESSYYVLHPSELSVFQEARDTLFEIDQDDESGELKLEKTFYDKDIPVIELWKYIKTN